MQNYDLLILGAGPAGLSAAVYALRYNLNTAILGGVPGGLMMETHKICNWPGEKEITGFELSTKMKEQAESLGCHFIYDQATGLTKNDSGWQIATQSGETYQAKVIIYSLGTEHRHLGLPVEEKFKGKGVSYCATCDAMFYKGKATAVIGGGNSAMTAALYLADLCPKVYLITRGPKLKGEVAWMNDVVKKNNIIHITETQVVDLLGETKLEKIVLDKAFEDSKELVIEGLFVEIGLNPRTELFKQIGGEVNEINQIKVNADMSTNLLGMLAAGDATNGSNGFRQIVTAVSEGAIAADTAYKLLSRQ
ncbi:hypothetical protein COT94_00920 [Candidatus Falkowbacteria bacterium CG10_big_fil_rev_8_21_14_0_10_37_14]|uniref:FAD/NAD(P)-binding domain-containing protein n=1 Tax=Candidatus Falkowbacteria bacterium CG10_big_fil_rev_8_21_14_0_10_37_14 TaxID=1974561 RepID=A0A2M6WUE6_9BACT|nr:FAD-dependent oxidoreductase [Candidatus Falkowbacteria bacterium]PIT96341.1 MAG: hypothetical protein COT94_00920 [Candidatus Falkowbacteria bacterium CG10_big_fil_rev_8_21_14_0_10_37_14]